MDYLFVYGTLRSDMGHPMYGVLERYAQLVGVGTVGGQLFNLGHYPGLVLGISQGTELLPDNGSKVWGEVYALTSDTAPTLLAILDDYESYDAERIEQSEYRRETIQVQLMNDANVTEVNQRSVAAWVYVYNRDIEAYQVIPSGNYADVVSM